MIAALIDRKRDLDERSAERRFIVRQLRGLWYTRLEPAGIIEDLDPFGGGSVACGRNAPRCLQASPPCVRRA